MDSDDDGTSGHEPASGWLSGAFRQFNFVALLREHTRIRRTCAELLRTYRQIESEWPQAGKPDLYARVVAAHSGADAEGVRRILRHAAESFALWPEERELNFRDLVSYFAVTACRSADPKTIGVRANVIDIVAHAIPAEL